MEELIAHLGKAFRGLWVSYRLLHNQENPDGPRAMWSVTFIHKGQYVETPEATDPIVALEVAIKIVEEW